ncbi:hypothetical protein PENSPDRAFT_576755 [Peniophora sp. CONT]|nr:hypothetical protein PENSPDRAFT_576755 [Peniophora sp. CONT]
MSSTASNTGSASATGSVASSGSVTGSAASGTNTGSSASGSAASGSAASGTGSQSGNSTISIPVTAPAGAITVTQPPQTSVAFFKIASGAPITFAWSMTNVLSTPTSLTVSAVCENGVTFPVGPTNGVIAGTDTSVVWDVYSFEQAHPESPLPQSTYTLEIFDERGMGAARSPGLLSPNSNLRFALYSPQPYTPLASGWSCSGCNVSPAEQLSTSPAFISVLATIMVMVLSGFALLRNGMH